MILPTCGLLINQPRSSANSGRTTNVVQQTTSVVYLSSSPGTVATSNSIQQTTSVLHLSSTIQPTSSVASLSSTPAILDTTIQRTTSAVYRSSIGVISGTAETARQTTSLALHLSSTPVISVTTQLTTNTKIQSPTPVILELQEILKQPQQQVQCTPHLLHSSQTLPKW